MKLKSEEDGLVTFYLPEKDKLTKHEVGQLTMGDQVTILWNQEAGRKWVRGFQDSHGLVWLASFE